MKKSDVDEVLDYSLSSLRMRELCADITEPGLIRFYLITRFLGRGAVITPQESKELLLEAEQYYLLHRDSLPGNACYLYLRAQVADSIRRNDRQETRKWLDELKELVDRNIYPPAFYWYQILLADHYFDLGDLNTASAELDKCGVLLDELPQSNEKIYIEATYYLRCAQLHKLFYDREKSIEHIQKAYSIADGFTDREFFSVVLHNFAMTLYEYGVYEKALPLFVESYTIKKEAGFVQEQARSMTNIANCYLVMQEYKEAAEWLEKTSAIYRSNNSLLEAVIQEITLGQAYLKLLPIGQTIQFIEKLRPDFEILVQSWENHEFHFEMERIFASYICDFAFLLVMAAQGDKDSTYAKEFELLCLRINQYSLNVNDIDGILKSSYLLHQFYHEIKAFDNAYKFLSMRFQYMLQFRSEQAELQIKRMSVHYELENARKELQILSLRNQNLEADMRLKDQELTTMALQAVRKQELLDSVLNDMRQILRKNPDEQPELWQALFRSLNNSSKSDLNWDSFQEQFQRVHSEFVEKIIRIYPDLSPTEIRVCCLMKINLSTKDIAHLMNIQARGVEYHRYHIRKKMKLVGKANLSLHLAAL
jgi:DNA-binding CsgD family transcriptional regulator/tetratricopeptide (TPR) repeat protein